MLQIRLIKGPASESGSGPKPSLAGNVTVACPDHLVLADLPVAKGIGGATAASLVKSVGRRSRRQLGERVHFCVRCDFPIAIYGRLSPCEHAFCLDCARSDSSCYLCDERIQKIQTIKIMEGIFICAAPHCLKSFLKKPEFESHIPESHADLLHPNAEKEDGNESEAQSVRQPTASESTARAPPRAVLSPGTNPQHNRPMAHPQEFGQFSDKQRGALPDTPFPEYPPMHSLQQPNFSTPRPSYGFYGAPHEMTRQDSAPDVGSQQGSVLGYPPGPATGINYPLPYPQPWNMLPVANPDSHGKAAFYQGEYGRNSGAMPPNPPQAMDALEPPRDGKAQPLQQQNQAQFYSGDAGFGWQHENHGSFGNSQD